jgi:hypothetical protein
MKAPAISAYQNYTPPVQPGNFEDILKMLFQEVTPMNRLVDDSGPPVTTARLKEGK